MAMIIPRWEWRTFGARFGAAEGAIASAVEGVEPVESDELYLLSPSGQNVKVRDDLMDIKVLVEVDGDGLEQWRPVMKAGFPLPAEEVPAVFEGLELPSPPLARAAYTLDQFVAELAEPAESLRSVWVHKRRYRFSLGGCMAELAEVGAAGRSTRTVAIESEDAAAVDRAVAAAGLSGYFNTSYPEGLARLLDDEPERFAVIDVGTNSVKFHIGERDAAGAWHVVVDRAEVTRLGEGIAEHGIITPDAMSRTAGAIEGMVAEARDHEVRAIAAVGTAGMRAAANSDDVVAAIRARSGVTVEAIPGDEEGRLAYLAVASVLGPAHGSLVVFDTGGGSSQFTFGHGPEVDERFSVPVGAVRYTERFGLDRAVSLESLGEALAAISADLSSINDRQPPDALVGMGGAITNITAVRYGLATYDPDRVQGAVLDREEIDRQIEMYRSRDAAARREIVGLQPKRADVILAGACIVRTVMDKLGKAELTVSDRGLRHGLLVERFGA